MEADRLQEIQQLGDLGLACLTCLIAEQHALILVDDERIGNVGDSIDDDSRSIFGLDCVTVDCREDTTLDEFRQAVLVSPRDDDGEDIRFRSKLPEKMFTSIREAGGRPRKPSLDERRVANVVVAKNINLASETIQIQALELIRTKRLFSHTALHSAPRTFLFIALNSIDSTVKLNAHLNDLLAICHFHQLELDDDTSQTSSLRRQPSLSDAASLSSLSRSINSYSRDMDLAPVISPGDLETLRKLSSNVKMTAEIATYMHNIIIAMRLSRFVAGGVTAKGSRHLSATIKAIAVLHGLSYVTPSLVALAVRKTYPHRIELATTETERSLRWGSDPAAVRQNMEGVTPESAIEAVLESVDTPL